VSDLVQPEGAMPFPRARSALTAAAAAASDPPRPRDGADDQEGEDRVGERELRRLAALLSCCTSSLGGLPIMLRVELGGALHALERHLAARGGGGGR
jgi:hypothetical protein